jgi:hypothetical protein
MAFIADPDLTRVSSVAILFLTTHDGETRLELRHLPVFPLLPRARAR